MKRTILPVMIVILLSSYINKVQSQEHAAAVTKTTSDKKVSLTITRGQCDSILQLWLSSQNSGNFEAYAGLYAPRFEGVKRAGKNKYNFNQLSWLKDRKRMFAKKMTVTAENLSVSLIGIVALIHFTQTWETKNYRDYGAKTLELSLIKGAIKITREEMFYSIKDTPKVNSTNGDFHFIVEENLLVIDHHPDLSIAQGQPYLAGKTNTSFCDVNYSQLDESYKKLIKSPLLIVSETGDTFTAKVSSVSLVARATPHFGTIEQWKTENVSDIDKAQQLWDMAQARDGVILAGKIDGKFDNALYAIPKFSGIPKIYKVSSSDTSYFKMALAAFKNIPAYLSAQKDFDKYESTGEWIQESTKQYSVFTHKSDQTIYIALKISAGQGCGDFYGSVLAIFKVFNGAIELVSNPDGIKDDDVKDDCFPAGAADLDNDGKPEFIDKGKIIRFNGSFWDMQEEIIVPFYDCGC